MGISCWLHSLSTRSSSSGCLEAGSGGARHPCLLRFQERAREAAIFRLHLQRPWFGFPASVAPILSGGEGGRHSVQQGWRSRSETSPHAWGACSPPPQAPPTPRPVSGSRLFLSEWRSQPGSLQWGSGLPYLPSALGLYVHLFSNSLGRCSSRAVCLLAGVRAACQTPALSRPPRSHPRSRPATEG